MKTGGYPCEHGYYGICAQCVREERDELRARVAELEARVERLTADRDRYKAWHDGVASRRLHVLQENGRVYDAIVRPQPLKENE